MEEKRSGASHLLSVGDKAPAFSLRDQDGNPVTLEDFKTRKNVVLVFYPGDNTPGCTKQLCAIRDRFELFADNDTVVFGINPQDPASHKKFIIKRSLPFRRGGLGARQCRGYTVRFTFAAHLLAAARKEGEIAIEVLAQLDAHRVRGIALTPTQGLARGMAVEDTGGPLKVPVGKGILSRMFDVFGNAIDRRRRPTDVKWRTVHRRPASVSAAFHQIRNLRDGDQGHRCAHAAGARRQGGTCSAERAWVRRCCSPK
jgi:hypothetical protein